MKKKLLFAIFALLPIFVMADGVEIDGVNYLLVSKTKEAKVISNENGYVGDIVIPETVDFEGEEYRVTSIDDCAFIACIHLSSITIPNTVTSIGNMAFSRCKGLEKITIPNSVETIGMCAFEACENLKSVILPNKLSIISRSLFLDCKSLSSVNLPEGLTTIESHAFCNCMSLTTLDIPNTVNSIMSSAFMDTSISSIIIPINVSSVEINNCYQLKKATVGCNMRSFAMENCPEIADVYCYAEKVPNASFKNSYIDNGTLHVPQSVIDEYKVSSPWSEFKNIIALTENDPNPYETTGITNVKLFKKNNGDYYNLNGQRISQPFKGIYIYDGKKVIIK